MAAAARSVTPSPRSAARDAGPSLAAVRIVQPRVPRLLAFSVMIAACGASPTTVAPIENRADPHPPAVPGLPPPAEPPPPVTASELTAAALLFEDEIIAATGYTGEFETGPLDVASAGETSQHFKAVGEQEPFDVALRLWQFDGDRAAALAHYDDLGTMLPSVTHTDEIATRSLRAAEGDVVGIAFLDESRALVVLLTCGDQQCTDVEIAVALARGAYRRIH